MPKHYAYGRSSPSSSVFSLLRWWFSRYSRLSSCPSPLLIAMIKSCLRSSNAGDQLHSVPQSSPLSVSLLAFEANRSQSVNWDGELREAQVDVLLCVIPAFERIAGLSNRHLDCNGNKLTLTILKSA